MPTARLSAIIIRLENSFVMDLKETIISSFFFHLIFLLLILAVSSYTTGFTGVMHNVISVDLKTEDGEDTAEAVTHSEDKPGPASSLPSDGEMSLPDQAPGTPQEEAKRVQEEKKAEAPPAPPKIETTQKPLAGKEGFDSMEAYYQFMMLHRKVFRQDAGARVNSLLGEAFKVNKREFYGGTAVVDLTFGTDGSLSQVTVDSASPDLKAFFEEISWASMPAPTKYSLRFARVRIEFTVLEGYMSFKMNEL